MINDLSRGRCEWILKGVDFLQLGWPGRGVRDAGSHAGLTGPVSEGGRGVEGTNGWDEGGM